MSDESRKGEELRERIAGFFHAADEGRRKPVLGQEAEALATAAGKLDQILADALLEEEARRAAERTEEERSLRAASERLERMLRGAGRKRTKRADSRNDVDAPDGA